MLKLNSTFEMAFLWNFLIFYTANVDFFNLFWNYLSIYLLCLSARRSVCPSTYVTYLRTFSTYPSNINLLNCPIILFHPILMGSSGTLHDSTSMHCYLFIYLSICLSIYLSSICLFIYLPIPLYLPIYPSFHQSTTAILSPTHQPLSHPPIH